MRDTLKDKRAAIRERSPLSECSSEAEEEQKIVSNFDQGPQKILNDLKNERLMRNRNQKNIYKKLVIHLSQQNRIVDLAKEQKSQLEV